MTSNSATTILLSTSCSGGCKHCPFSNPGLEKLFLSLDALTRILSHADRKLAVLSGGEPFEHPEFSKILDNLSKQNHQFRIATGGFIDFLPWIEKLKSLSRPNGPLEGISLGTDVISTRITSSRWAQTWKNNVKLLFEFQIPYSLTLTLGPDLNFVWVNIWKWVDFFEGKPNFIYLRYSEEECVNDWIEKIHESFGDIKIIKDNFSS